MDTQSGEGTRGRGGVGGGSLTTTQELWDSQDLGGTTSWFILPCARHSWPRREAARSPRQKQQGLPHQEAGNLFCRSDWRTGQRIVSQCTLTWAVTDAIIKTMFMKHFHELGFHQYTNFSSSAKRKNVLCDI